MGSFSTRRDARRPQHAPPCRSGPRSEPWKERGPKAAISAFDGAHPPAREQERAHPLAVKSGRAVPGDRLGHSPTLHSRYRATAALSPPLVASSPPSPPATPPFPRRRPLTVLPFLLLVPLLAAANRVLEDGYTVTTAADLNHLPASSGLHPYALVPRPHAGDLVVLDSAGSALYTLPFSPSGGGAEPRRLAGGVREAGYSDGGPGDAAFDRPRSVAVDAADNVYVADRIHGAIRKVAPSGEWANPLNASFVSLSVLLRGLGD
ncbi:hypothetical protein PR202_ga20928 [Eleusine coracana subsp. coracana]|uniref:NHL repeat-containing protein n=1 Tax=Eleusine coracana subsp. coracana TaxID=191504 RepID=A0AAV5CZ76_ELECO|nr:hypothetical protein PR202_ga20928 [Eleusine coracana subsp. coracana]